MTLIHCGYQDCDNNEDGICHAAAIRLDRAECCLTYQAPENGIRQAVQDEGDRLVWDQEYFEDDPLDDDSVY